MKYENKKISLTPSNTRHQNFECVCFKFLIFFEYRFKFFYFEGDMFQFIIRNLGKLCIHGDGYHFEHVFNFQIQVVPIKDSY